MQTLNLDEVCHVRVNSRNSEFTQTWENNTKSTCPPKKDKHDSLVLSRLKFACSAHMVNL